jgi:hypothetical protein
LNVGFLKFCVTMSLAARRLKSAFGYAISDIIQCCSKEKVSRIKAWRIVAVVQNFFSGWRRTDNVGSLHCLSVFFHTPVSVLGFSSSPQPARPKFGTILWNRPVHVNPFPKPLHKRASAFFAACVTSLCASVQSLLFSFHVLSMLDYERSVKC